MQFSENLSMNRSFPSNSWQKEIKFFVVDAVLIVTGFTIFHSILWYDME